MSDIIFKRRIPIRKRENTYMNSVFIVTIQGQIQSTGNMYLDNNRSHSLVHTEVCSRLTSVLLGELPHYLNRLL